MKTTAGYSLASEESNPFLQLLRGGRKDNFKSLNFYKNHREPLKTGFLGDFLIFHCLNGHWDFVIQGVGLIPLQGDALGGKLIKVLNAGIQLEAGGGVRLPLEEFFHNGHMAVIDMGVGDHMDQLAGLKAGDLGEHAKKRRVLAHIPVVGREHILGALV